MSVVCHFFWLISSALCLEELFRDDFKTPILNLSKWNSVYQNSSVNDELEFYLPENLALLNGSLIITARKEHHVEEATPPVA